MKTVVDLSGQWHVVLDTDLEYNEATCLSASPVSPIHMPSSLDEAGLGISATMAHSMQGLSRRHKFVGTAWYYRTVTVPTVTEILRAVIFLERCHWESTLFVNGELVGTCGSLSTPHTYDVTRFITAPEITVVVKINNAVDLAIGRRGHMVTDWTQTNWNGMIGRMELRVHTGSQVSLNAVSVLAGGGSIHVVGEVTRYPTTGVLALSVDGRSCGDVPAIEQGDSSATFNGIVTLPQPLGSWSEWHPGLHEVSLVDAEMDSADSLVTGAAWLDSRGTLMYLNDRRLYLRGTLECAIFPLTGHPPMDVDSWRSIMRTVADHGLNHIRFHSWCPPDAAFAAADEVGILLQAELPLWITRQSFAADDLVFQWARNEALRIYAAFGHHPSFGMFCLGNELVYRGNEPHVEQLMRELKRMRPGRLVTAGAYSHPANPETQYVITCDSGQNQGDSQPLRASSWWQITSRFDRELPATTTNYNAAMASFTKPVVAHEVGQWVVFPDVHNRTEYTGVLTAHNFEWIAEMLKQRGMLDKSTDFTFASGRLSALLYKEEIESLLRTADVSGFQLLDLHDFPGQGTATIGMLDAFWRPKGFITADEFRAFCRADVPLACLDRYIFAAGTSIVGASKLAHYGPKRTGPVTLTARLSSGNSSLTCEQRCGTRTLMEPGLASFDDLNLTLPVNLPACKAVLSLAVDDAPPNCWDVWIYPATLTQPPLNDVIIADAWSYGLANELRRGRTVWLRHTKGGPSNAVEGQFSSCFWSPVHFKGQAGTTGLLIDNFHPLFTDFPTERFAQWQWWDIITHSRSLVINDLPLDFQPIVQSIDRFTRNDKLAVIMEATVGKGRILITCIDFDTDRDIRPATRQLEHSIRRYLASQHFNPHANLPVELLDTVYLTED